MVEGVEKSCESPPDFAIDEMVREPEPVFVTTTNCEPLVVATGCEPKLTVVGEKVMPRFVTAVGVVTVATPLSRTNCGLPVTELSRKSRVVERLPLAFRAGLKRTTTVQDVPAVSGAAVPQLFGPIAKSLTSPPLSSGAVKKIRSAPPVFVSVTVWLALMAPCGTLPKLIVVALTVAIGFVDATVAAIVAVGVDVASRVAVTVGVTVAVAVAVGVGVVVGSAARTLQSGVRRSDP